MYTSVGHFPEYSGDINITYTDENNTPRLNHGGLTSEISNPILTFKEKLVSIYQGYRDNMLFWNIVGPIMIITILLIMLLKENPKQKLNTRKK